MKNLFSTFFLFLIALFCGQLLTAQTSQYLPLSTPSDEAESHYHMAMKATDEFDFDAYYQHMEAAMEKDPNFFLAVAQQGFFHMSRGNMEETKKAFGKALAMNVDLNDAEKEIHKAVKALSEDPSANIGSYGDALAQLHPNCVEAHLWRGYFNLMSQNIEPAVMGFRTVLKLNPEMTTMHNMLGYTYMGGGKMDKAKMHFDKYLAAYPDHPNPYDSLGDYYMAAQDYQKAETHYMKAYQIDDSWTASKERAAKARKMAEGDQ
jgi:tetratricopeptide (TPR) repeat protein